MAVNKENRYLISLLDSVIKEKSPDRPDGDVDLLAVMRLAERHSVANMAYSGFERLNCRLSEKGHWTECRDRAIMRDITQHFEFNEICTALSQRNIRFLPLKGFILKELYPESYMRVMSDLDILVDAENASAVRDVMVELGYAVESFGNTVHDVYHKPPVMSVEIHRELFERCDERFRRIIPDPWAIAEIAEGLRYEFAAEDCLKYLLCHALKHFDEGGTGIRTFIDLHLYLQRFGKEIDLQRLIGEFDRAGCGDACRTMLGLSEVWFGDSPHNGKTLDAESYVFGSGTYGTIANAVNNRVKNGGRAAYVLELIFPPPDKLISQYGILRKAPVLMPFVWLYRLVTKPIKNFSQNRAKLKALKK